MWIKLEKEHWCELVPKLAERRHEVKLTVLWNKIVQTDRTVPNNKTDILKVKVKFSRYRPGVAQRVGRGIALLFHDRGTRSG